LTNLFALVLVLGLLPVANASTGASFAAPSQWQGDTHVHNPDWVLLILDPNSVADLEFRAKSGNVATWYTAFKPTIDGGDTLWFSVPMETPGTEQAFESPFSLNLTFGSSTWKSIYVQADHISLQLGPSTGDIDVVEKGYHVATALAGQQYPVGTVRSDMEVVSADMVSWATRQAETYWGLQASGNVRIETLNATGACHSGSCPMPFSSSRLQQSGTSLDRLEYLRLDGPGSLNATGKAWALAAVSPELSASLVGVMRMPGLEMNGSCAVSSCFQGHGETLQTRGQLELESLTWSAEQGRRIRGSIYLTNGNARLDETAIDSSLLGTASIVGIGVAGVGLATFARVLAPFFTRLTKEQALEHPRRRRIFEYIQQNPGANFREVARRTGIAAGTVRHHLNVLARSDIIVEHQHGSTVRLFENLSKFQANWADHVLLREPSLGELYDWLKANPGAPQKAVLEGMEPQGWSRSTTQHRLSRLVDGGLATIRLQGRLKIYTALDRSSDLPAPS
jgi:predicted transcriptional regulator